MRIKESCMENTYGYHLSPYSFSEPKINYKAGFGTSFYGAGFYITLDKNVIDVIKGEAQDMFAEYFIYTIQVDENANIVDEDEENGLQLYAQLVEQFNGDEVKASAEMVKRGIDGILYYSEEDGHSIVFYNPKMAKIVHTEYHEGWGERSELNEGKLKKAVIATMLALGLVAGAHASPKTHIRQYSDRDYVHHVKTISNTIKEKMPGTEKAPNFYVVDEDDVEDLLERIQRNFDCNRETAEAFLIAASIDCEFYFENGTQKLFKNKNFIKYRVEKLDKNFQGSRISCW